MTKNSKTSKFITKYKEYLDAQAERLADIDHGGFSSRSSRATFDIRDDLSNFSYGLDSPRDSIRSIPRHDFPYSAIKPPARAQSLSPTRMGAGPGLVKKGFRPQEPRTATKLEPLLPQESPQGPAMQLSVQPRTRPARAPGGGGSSQPTPRSQRYPTHLQPLPSSERVPPNQSEYSMSGGGAPRAYLPVAGAGPAHHITTVDPTLLEGPDEEDPYARSASALPWVPPQHHQPALRPSGYPSQVWIPNSGRPWETDILLAGHQVKIDARYTRDQQRVAEWRDYVKAQEHEEQLRRAEQWTADMLSEKQRRKNTVQLEPLEGAHDRRTPQSPSKVAARTAAAALAVESSRERLEQELTNSRTRASPRRSLPEEEPELGPSHLEVDAELFEQVREDARRRRERYEQRREEQREPKREYSDEYIRNASWEESERQAGVRRARGRPEEAAAAGARQEAASSSAREGAASHGHMMREGLDHWELAHQVSEMGLQEAGRFLGSYQYQDIAKVVGFLVEMGEKDFACALLGLYPTAVIIGVLQHLPQSLQESILAGLPEDVANTVLATIARLSGGVEAMTEKMVLAVLNHAPAEEAALLISNLAPEAAAELILAGAVDDVLAILSIMNHTASAAVLRRMPAAQAGAMLAGMDPARAAQILEGMGAAQCAEALGCMDCVAAAGALEAMDSATAAEALALLDPAQAAALLHHMTPAKAVEALRRLGVEQQAAILGGMEARAAAALLEGMHPGAAAAALSLMPAEQAAGALAHMPMHHARAALACMGPAAAARALAKMDGAQAAALLQGMDRDAAAGILSALDGTEAARLLGGMDAGTAGALLAAMEPSQAAAALAKMDRAQAARALMSMSPEQAGALLSAMGIRTEEAIALLAGMAPAAAAAALRSMDPSAAAALLQGMDSEAAAAVLATLDAMQAAQLLRDMDPLRAAAILTLMASKEAAEVLMKLGAVAAADVLNNMGAASAGAVLASMSVERAADMLRRMDKDKAVQALEAMEAASALALLKHLAPARAAELLSRMDPKAAAALLDAMSASEVANVLSALDPAKAARLLASMDINQAAAALAKMDAEAAALVLEQMEAGEAARLLTLLDPKAACVVLLKLGPQNSARLLAAMDPDEAAIVLVYGGLSMQQVGQMVALLQPAVAFLMLQQMEVLQAGVASRVLAQMVEAKVAAIMECWAAGDLDGAIKIMMELEQVSMILGDMASDPAAKMMEAMPQTFMAGALAGMHVDGAVKFSSAMVMAGVIDGLVATIAAGLDKDQPYRKDMILLLNSMPHRLAARIVSSLPRDLRTAINDNLNENIRIEMNAHLIYGTLKLMKQGVVFKRINLAVNRYLKMQRLKARMESVIIMCTDALEEITHYIHPSHTVVVLVAALLWCVEGDRLMQLMPEMVFPEGDMAVQHLWEGMRKLVDSGKKKDHVSTVQSMVRLQTQLTHSPEEMSPAQQMYMGVSEELMLDNITVESVAHAMRPAKVCFVWLQVLLTMYQIRFDPGHEDDLFDSEITFASLVKKGSKKGGLKGLAKGAKITRKLSMKGPSLKKGASIDSVKSHGPDDSA